MSEALLTDLYELTMMAGYHAEGRADDLATFDLYHRHPPRGVDLVVTAGLEPVLGYLGSLHFTGGDLDYLRSLDMFDDAFLDHLAGLRFTGDVWAMPEGTPVFGDEPILRVTAPLAQAQLIETTLLHRISYSSLVASNAVQIARAAGGKPLLEMGARRAHGPDGALTGARAAFIGGCSATSNVEAGRAYDVPLAGTQAHSWVMAFGDELEAFRAFARSFPDNCVLLVDTYDTLGSGVPNAIRVAAELADDGHRLRGVRLDSGDLADLARRTRPMLDEAGLEGTQIIASGDLDAGRIAALEEADAPIDGYGVGTSLITAWHDPAFSGVYKLTEIGGRPVVKVSGDPAKTTSPGRKQVWRRDDGDVIGLHDEEMDGEPLLVEAIRNGRRVLEPQPVSELRRRCRQRVQDLRPRLRDGSWPVRRSDGLERLREQLLGGGGRSD
ncbi:MAG: nicotinate phosphoribosyltransferase [Actinobacteria bacterium]|nr:nicotinate phosphoribosyltransferase [Actinomycetota bacterium]